MVADLDVLDERTDCNNDTGTLVSSNKGELGVKGPVTLPGVEIGVANYQYVSLRRKKDY